MALTITPEFTKEMEEVRRHIGNFFSYAKSDAAGWSDAQWNYLSELYNATAVLSSAVEALVKANQPEGSHSGASVRPPGLRR